MTTLNNTLENKAKVNGLISIEKLVGEISWTGNVTHDNLDKCLAALNLNSFNSGWYKPLCVRINKLSGYYMINEDGSLFFESRIIKVSDDKYLIEHLTNRAYNKFENLYSEFSQEN
jgi:hypothetical protein